MRMYSTEFIARTATVITVAILFSVRGLSAQKAGDEYFFPDTETARKLQISHLRIFLTEKDGVRLPEPSLYLSATIDTAGRVVEGSSAYLVEVFWSCTYDTRGYLTEEIVGSPGPVRRIIDHRHMTYDEQGRRTHYWNRSLHSGPEQGAFYHYQDSLLD